MTYVAADASLLLAETPVSDGVEQIEDAGAAHGPALRRGDDLHAHKGAVRSRNGARLGVTSDVASRMELSTTRSDVGSQ